MMKHSLTPLGQEFFPIKTHSPRSYKPIFKKIKVLNNDKNLNELRKRNPRTIIKFSLFDSSQKPVIRWEKRINTPRKLSQILQREKRISNLGPNARFLCNISKLQKHHRTTSLDIELSSLKTLTITKHRQPISKVLCSFKKLKSIAITFDRRVEMAQEEKFRLYYPLHCLRLLESLTLNFANSPGLPECLQKLSKLKSLRLNFNGSMIDFSTNTSLAFALESLPLLQTFSLDLSNALGRNKNYNAPAFFTSLSTLKFMKHFHLNLDNHEINGRADHESQGSLEAFTINCKANFNKKSLVNLVLALKIFPSLKHLGLHFDSKCKLRPGCISRVVSASSKKPHFLSSFEVEIHQSNWDWQISRNPRISGKALLPLMSLTSLILHMKKINCLDFSKGLRRFAKLKQLTLIAKLGNFSDQDLEILGDCLKGLKSLKSLKLELPGMQMTPTKGFISFCSGLESLTQLTSLYLNTCGNCRNSGKSDSEGDFESLFKAFSQLKMLGTVQVIAPGLIRSEQMKYVKHLPGFKFKSLENDQ